MISRSAPFMFKSLWDLFRNAPQVQFTYEVHFTRKAHFTPQAFHRRDTSPRPGSVLQHPMASIISVYPSHLCHPRDTTVYQTKSRRGFIPQRTAGAIHAESDSWRKPIHARQRNSFLSGACASAHEPSPTTSGTSKSSKMKQIKQMLI